MKKIFFLLLVSLSLNTSGQQPIYFNLVDGFYVVYGLSTTNKPASPPNNCYFVEVNTNKTFVSNGGTWSLVGIGVDSIATRLAFVTDSLATALASSIAATYATISNLALKVNISDTSAMLANYRNGLNGKLATNGNGSALTGLTASQVSLGNVTNESKATMFTNPAFTGTVILPASTSFTTPVIGAATGTSFTATGAIKSSGTAGIGYVSTAGGTVTQATSKTTGVTLNKICGQITMNGAALAAAAEVAFTLTNSTIALTDVIIVNVQSVGTAGAYLVTVGAVAAGSCSITVGNASAGSLSQALVLNFVVIKSVNN